MTECDFNPFLKLTIYDSSLKRSTDNSPNYDTTLHLCEVVLPMYDKRILCKKAPLSHTATRLIGRVG